MLKMLTRAYMLLVFHSRYCLKKTFIVEAPASILKGLVHANFSPLSLLLSFISDVTAFKNNRRDTGTMNKSTSVVCKYDCTIPAPASLALLLIPHPLPRGVAKHPLPNQ